VRSFFPLRERILGGLSVVPRPEQRLRPLTAAERRVCAHTPLRHDCIASAKRQHRAISSSMLIATEV
jgi:hypothetical protein